MTLNHLVKSAVSNLWPTDFVDRLIFETRVTLRHAASRAKHRSIYRGQKNLFVNVGGGNISRHGWVNLDIARRPAVTYWDCRRRLPFDDRSVAFIFAEHVFEHFSSTDACAFLAECRRCLQPEGALRIIVPDAGMYLEQYVGDDRPKIAAARPLIESNEHFVDRWLGKTYRTKMEFINEVFRQGAEHKYAYDAETLMLHLRLAGFEPYAILRTIVFHRRRPRY